MSPATRSLPVVSSLQAGQPTARMASVSGLAPRLPAIVTRLANVVPWVGGASATTRATLAASPGTNFGPYRAWKPPSECPSRSTFAAPVAARTRPMKAAISVADWGIGVIPPTGTPGMASP